MHSATLPRPPALNQDHQPPPTANRRAFTGGELLALAAAACAALAALLGFLPGIYRDPPPLVAQSHGQDFGTLVFALPLLLVGIWKAAHGSTRGYLVAVGALGYLLYTYLVFAFYAVLNPLTVLYIAVVGCAMWSLFCLVPSVSQAQVDAAVGDTLPRRSTGVFFIVIALLFALLWLSQMATAAVSGTRPQALIDSGWPTSPIYVLDLAFVLPLLALTGMRLLSGRPAARLAVPLLVFVPLLAVGILSISAFAVADGQPLETVQAGIFLVLTLLGTALAWRALRGSA